MSSYASKTVRASATLLQLIRESNCEKDALGNISADAERRIFSNIAGQSLSELGYGVILESDATHSVLEASRGHEKLLILIENGGKITSDHAGISDGGCEARQRQFETEMGKRGVMLARGSEARQTRHNDPRGGALIAEAGRQRAPDLAKGLLLSRKERGGSGEVRKSLFEAPQGGTSRKEKEHA
ncbi:MAG: hypothetical protein LBE16_00160 [Clostridiales Family XIII bacterium]|jgi:hypothetical protein|nr:hypothetical protein [Clostridiales Family XIII bacterium]